MNDMFDDEGKFLNAFRNGDLYFDYQYQGINPMKRLAEFMDRTDYTLPFNDEALTMWKIFYLEEFPLRTRSR